jgi:hypothetical protein
LVLRALLGGAIVSAFALASDVLKPKSFAGLFGAAPSVGIASLALTFHSRGASYAATEARSMIVGVVAFAAYAYLVARLLVHGRRSVRVVAPAALVAWFAVAFGLWGIATHANLL